MTVDICPECSHPAGLGPSRSRPPCSLCDSYPKVKSDPRVNSLVTELEAHMVTLTEAFERLEKNTKWAMEYSKKLEEIIREIQPGQTIDAEALITEAILRTREQG